MTKATPSPLPGEDDGSLEGKMERVAIALANDIIDGKVVAPDNIAAFKALTGYFSTTRKPAKGTRNDDEDGDVGGNFDDFRKSVGTAANGSGARD